VVEDEPNTLEAMLAAFASEGIRVVATARTAAAARKILAGPVAWDVAVLDLRLQGVVELDLVRTTRETHPGRPVIVHSAHGEANIVLAAVLRGAMGYILKGEGLARLVGDVRTVAEGGGVLTAEVTALILDWVRQGGDAPVPSAVPLSPREMEVLRAIDRGCSYKEIAHDLAMGDGTVRTHVASIYRKLQANNSRAAIKAAQRLGILV
jgi:DNA-binding NarL/FixJ family response regulator